MKLKIKCPCCGSENRHTYRVPGHPELTGKHIELFALKHQGVSIARLVCCEDCGNIYDAVVAKKFKPYKPAKGAKCNKCGKKLILREDGSLFCDTCKRVRRQSRTRPRVTGRARLKSTDLA